MKRRRSLHFNEQGNIDFITEWTVGALETIILPFVSGGTFSGTVNYGDGSGNLSISSYNDPNATHEYTLANTYVVTLSGTFSNIQFAGGAQKDKITKVTQWGDIGLATLNFIGCSNLTITATDILQTGLFNSFANLFYQCSVLTTVPNMDLWDTSSITSFYRSFSNCPVFNQPIGAWDVSNVTIFDSTFENCSLFNQPLSWITTSATSMESMFRNADDFNQDLSSFDMNGVLSVQTMFANTSSFNHNSLLDWDVSTITTFSNMFSFCVFNQPLTNWITTSATNFSNFIYGNAVFNQPVNHFDMTGVTNMVNMLSRAWNFDQPLNSWVFPLVTSLSGVLHDARSFNQDLSAWDVKDITNMSTLFSACYTFNTSLGAWDTSKVTTMQGMFFSALVWDKDISALDTTEVLDMKEMFRSAKAFNKSLATFNTAKVTNMDKMFYNTETFNQDISHFNVALVTNLTEFFGRHVTHSPQALSTANYDLLLVAFDGQVLQSGIITEFEDIKYTKTQTHSGTTDGTTTNKIVDSGADFSAVNIGDIIHNTTDDTYAKVTALDSTTILSINADIMISGETYQIETSNAVKAKENMINSDSWTIIDAGGV